MSETLADIIREHIKKTEEKNTEQIVEFLSSMNAPQQKDVLLTLVSASGALMNLISNAIIVGGDDPGPKALAAHLLVEQAEVLSGASVEDLLAMLQSVISWATLELMLARIRPEDREEAKPLIAQMTAGNPSGAARLLDLMDRGPSWDEVEVAPESL